MRIAVLDDYLKVAPNMAKWDSLNADVSFFSEYIQPAELAKTLESFDVISPCANALPFRQQ